ncbi:hypothetical protein [uncultured Bifidobacterium sp.]|uniref:hypothetical protein n=1 Tax=uncultured Bifidobacterium sp. TaxID=165187 RepID=UPI00258D02C8|nr:hypothetical protein [uncultured Bifidobacterium sp.]
MNGLDKVEKTLIVTLVVSVAAMLFLMGLSVYSYWYVGTHPDYGMTTVKTGDVTWVCLTDRGKTIGCDTVEEYQ